MPTREMPTRDRLDAIAAQWDRSGGAGVARLAFCAAIAFVAVAAAPGCADGRNRMYSGQPVSDLRQVCRRPG